MEDNKQNINKNAQEYINKKANLINDKIGIIKGYKYSMEIKKILCRKCLITILKEFGGENPNPENPQLYCEICRRRIEKLTKEKFF